MGQEDSGNFSLEMISLRVAHFSVGYFLWNRCDFRGEE